MMQEYTELELRIHIDLDYQSNTRHLHENIIHRYIVFVSNVTEAPPDKDRGTGNHTRGGIDAI